MGLQAIFIHVTLFYVFALLPQTSLSDPFNPADLRRIDDFISELLHCKNVPSLSLAIVQNEKTIVTKGYGYADIEDNIPATDTTTYCVASLTKAFTSTLIAKLLASQDGRTNYTWNTPVKDIIGDSLRFSSDVITDNVNLLDLLSHRTSIPRYDFLWVGDSFTRQDIIRYMDSSNGFRTVPVYNNIMYLVAGHVAEKLGGASWEELVKKHLLQPLNMTSTCFYSDSPNKDRVFASPYETINGIRYKLDRERFSGTQSIAPAIALCSNAVDMAQWLKFQLRKGKDDTGVQLIPESFMLTTHRPLVIADDMLYNLLKKPVMPVTDSIDKYALGWFNGYYKGLPTLKHHGRLPGYYSMITQVPSSNLSIFTSVNGEGTIAHVVKSLVHTYITDVMRGDTPWINTTQACSFPEPWKKGVPVKMAFKLFNTNLPPRRPLQQYVGRYGNMLYGNVTVSLNRTRNRLQLFYGKLHFSMYPASQRDVFHLQSVEETWMIQNFQVTFGYSASKKSVRNITVPFTDDEKAPVFERGLKYHETHNDQEYKVPLQCHRSAAVPATAVGLPQILTLYLICFILISGDVLL